MTDLGSHADRHYDDEDLVAYLDGEVGPEDRSAVVAHIERCWECRSRLRSLQTAIDRYLQAQRSRSVPEFPPASVVTASLRRKFAEQSAATTSAFRRPLILFRRFCSGVAHRPAWAVATLIIAIVALTFTWFDAPLAANAVLARSEAQELLDKGTVKAVVRSVCTVERFDGITATRTPIATVETTADYVTAAVGVSVRLADGSMERLVFADRSRLALSGRLRVTFGEPLGSYLASRQWFPAVSALSYRQLLEGRGRDDATAERVGTRIELRHPFRSGHPSGLAEVRLWVDARTYLPLRLSLVVGARERHEFRLFDGRTERLVRNHSLGEWFESIADRPPAGSPAPATPATRARVVRKPQPLLYADSPANPSEVAVAVRLHDLGADLGEEINVFPMSDGSVLVQGLVDNEARKREIEHHLAALNGRVRVEMYTPSSLSPAVELYDAPWARFDDTRDPTAVRREQPTAQYSSANSPLFDALSTHFARTLPSVGGGPTAAEVQKAAAQFTNEILKQSADTLFHAWALRRLDLQFYPARTALLLPDRLREIDSLRAGHRAAISERARNIAGAIHEVLPELHVSEGRQPPSETTALLRRAIDQYELATRLLATTSSRHDPNVTAARLLAVLSELQ